MMPEMPQGVEIRVDSKKIAYEKKLKSSKSSENIRNHLKIKMKQPNVYPRSSTKVFKEFIIKSKKIADKATSKKLFKEDSLKKNKIRRSTGKILCRSHVEHEIEESSSKIKQNFESMKHIARSCISSESSLQMTKAIGVKKPKMLKSRSLSSCSKSKTRKRSERRRGILLDKQTRVHRSNRQVAYTHSKNETVSDLIESSSEKKLKMHESSHWTPRTRMHPLSKSTKKYPDRLEGISRKREKKLKKITPCPHNDLTGEASNQLIGCQVKNSLTVKETIHFNSRSPIINKSLPNVKRPSIKIKMDSFKVTPPNNTVSFVNAVLNNSEMDAGEEHLKSTLNGDCTPVKVDFLYKPKRQPTEDELNILREDLLEVLKGSVENMPNEESQQSSTETPFLRAPTGEKLRELEEGIKRVVSKTIGDVKPGERQNFMVEVSYFNLTFFVVMCFK